MQHKYTLGILDGSGSMVSQATWEKEPNAKTLIFIG